MAGLQEAVAPIPERADDISPPDGGVTMLREAPPRADSGIFESSPPTRVHRIEGYGHTRWGMSAADVLDVCPHARMAGPERMEERKRVAKLPAEVAYIFADDRPYAASVMFKSSLDNGMEFITKFKNLRRLLSKKYGEPADSKTTFTGWRSCNSGFVLEHSSYHGVLVESGRMQMSCSWEIEETKVVMALGCKTTRQPSITIEYESTHLKEETPLIEEEQILEDL
jgi:hypothetical protein